MLSAVEMDILSNLLTHGDNTPGNIAENTGRHQTSISSRLADLDDKCLVESKGRGVWTLTIEGGNMAQTILDHRRKEGCDPDL
jgi:predicted transcriptional regulator